MNLGCAVLLAILTELGRFESYLGSKTDMTSSGLDARGVVGEAGIKEMAEVFHLEMREVDSAIY